MKYQGNFPIAVRTSRKKGEKVSSSVPNNKNESKMEDTRNVKVLPKIFSMFAEN